MRAKRVYGDRLKSMDVNRKVFTGDEHGFCYAFSKLYHSMEAPLPRRLIVALTSLKQVSLLAAGNSFGVQAMLIDTTCKSASCKRVHTVRGTFTASHNRRLHVAAQVNDRCSQPGALQKRSLPYLDSM